MKKQDKTRILAFWLVPCEKDKQVISTVISELSKKIDSASFEPHVTLYASNKLSKTKALEIFSQASKNFLAPLIMSLSKVEYGETFTESIFCRFEHSEKLADLSKKLENLCGEKYELDPHLSLAYGDFKAGLKQDLIKEIAFQLNKIRFDTIKIIEAYIPVMCNADVECWEEIKGPT